MLVVLWVMSVAAVFAMAAALAGRNGAGGERNRVQLEKADWAARGCGLRMLSAVDSVISSSRDINEAEATWRALTGRVDAETVVRGLTCEVELEAAGTKLDINSASAEMTARILEALSYSGEAPQMVDALADWIDADDEPRAAGAERSWYAAAVRALPRNDSLADIRELSRVRGFEQLARFDSVLSTDPGRVSLATAPVTVLLAVPGFNTEAAERVVALARAGTPLRDLAELVPELSESAATTLLARYRDAVRLTTPDPDAWIMTIRATNGLPSSTVTLKWRLVRSGRGVAIAHTRSGL